MGIQTHINFGYGFEFIEPKQFKKIDFWDLIEDEYPLLEYSLAGNYNHEGSAQVVICVKETMVEEFGFGIIDASPSIQKEHSVEIRRGIEQLKAFINKYTPDAQPSFLAWSYQG